MSRSAVDWRSASRKNYIDFKKEYPNIKLSFDDWEKIIYSFNYAFRDYILETGDKAKFPYGFGDFSIIKTKRNKTKVLSNGDEVINLPIDWIKSKAKHKKIYLMNYHTEGFSYKWGWFKRTSRIKFHDLWYFKASRVSNRILAHYLKTNNKYQHLYQEWSNK